MGKIKNSQICKMLWGNFWQNVQNLRVHNLSDFCARGFGRFVGKVFRAEKFSPRNVGRRIFPSQKYFFCVRGENSSRNLCRRWFFHRRVINFLANSPKNGKIPKKALFGGPPLDPPKNPPKTPQNPPPGRGVFGRVVHDFAFGHCIP